MRILSIEISKQTIGGLALIGAVCAGIVGAFAYTAGWLSPQRLSPPALVDALKPPNVDPTGHRRNHAKGICFTGTFKANGNAEKLSTASMLAAGEYPVIGRFAIGTGDPHAADASAPVRSMAVRIVAPDGQEWRSGMNNVPLFPVKTPEAFYALTEAMKPGNANVAVPDFLAAHPEAGAFFQYVTTTPPTSSFADENYYSVDAFRLVDAEGRKRAVRWAMMATIPPVLLDKAAIPKLDPDFLEKDLTERLARGTLTWQLSFTLAEPDDPTDDPTKQWPASRERLAAGTLTIDHAADEASGPCRDYNYDPLILPFGIEAADDLILPARSAAYAVSFDRRSAETPSPKPGEQK